MAGDKDGGFQGQIRVPGNKHGGLHVQSAWQVLEIVVSGVNSVWQVIGIVESNVKSVWQVIGMVGARV